MDFSGYDLILTSNHRLSASLDSPVPVQSFSRWLESAFESSGSPLTLLSSHQQLFIIKTIIQDTFPEFLGLSALVQSAWNLCAHHQVSIHDARFNKNEDTQLFQTIAKHLEEYYRKYQLTDIPREMVNLSLPAKTGLLGFGELSPLEQVVLNKGIPLKHEKPTQKITQTSYKDPQTELKTLILWAKQQPRDLQIGCVIPDLESHRDKILYYLDYLDIDSKHFTVSAVKKLSDYYFIQDCFSQFMSDEKILKPSEWTKIFQHQLEHSPFILDRTLNNEEFQLSEKLKEIFKSYQNFDIANRTLNFDEAVSELKNLCSRVPFQSTASKSANIHFLSLLDSKGLLFDKLWVSGMDSRHWPSKSKFNPLLPFQHVVTENRDWKNTATEIIYSYPLQVDETTTVPAKILDGIPVENIDISWPNIAIGSSLGNHVPRDDTVAVNIADLKRHGTQIFKDHIACPFRAFAKHRLHAVKLEEPQMGLNALQKGNTVHEVLEHLWKAIESKQNLLAIDHNTLRELIDKIINNSLKKFSKTIQPIFIQAEKARLEKLILDWLELEKSREDFVVMSTEQTLETQLGGLPLKLRIDRIDQISPDKYLIIDYKTSQYDIRGDYLDEPQLPLYAVVSAQSVDKIAYAYLRTGNSKLKEIPVGQLKQEWEAELLKVAQDFLKGNAEVKPKYGEETCRMCDLGSLCRVRS